MIKLIFLVVFRGFIGFFNKKNIFYCNIIFFLRFLFIFKFIFKDNLWINLRYIFGYDLYSFFLLILRI